MIDWVGQGIKFPSTFNVNKGTDKTTDEYRIAQSIYVILSTPIGTRFFLPSFGSRLHELIFEPNDMILQDMLEYYSKEALDRWEPRITGVRVMATVIVGDNTVPVKVFYRLKNSNVEYNYVYPFQRSVMELGNK